MTYNYLDHPADIGIQGIGNTLGESFEEAARALYGIMVNLEKVEPKEEVKIECEARDTPLLLVEWLNKLLSNSEYFFSRFKIESMRDHKLKGKAFGEKIDLEKHQVETEVKAATYSGLKVEEKNGRFYAQCVVDV